MISRHVFGLNLVWRCIFWSMLVFLLAIHSDEFISSEHLYISIANQLWMEVDFLKPKSIHAIMVRWFFLNLVHFWVLQWVNSGVFWPLCFIIIIICSSRCSSKRRRHRIFFFYLNVNYYYYYYYKRSVTRYPTGRREIKLLLLVFELTVFELTECRSQRGINRCWYLVTSGRRTPEGERERSQMIG